MSRSREELIKDFHQAFGLSIDEEPTVRLLELRRTLIGEEVKELFADMDSAIAHLKEGKAVPQALYSNMLKELADVQVVVSGTSVALKPLNKLDEALSRVHLSNMSKLGEDGKPIFREDGKVLKGPKYFSPDLADLI
ncbi:MAG: nucleoside triphosphate pyrophosphohydrolase family protein [bacterium]|nr:nucleoside triphosphate pyrophosphohydrolase family protein [bacterium]